METLAPLSLSREEKEEEEEDFLGKDHSLVCPASPFNVGEVYMQLNIHSHTHASNYTKLVSGQNNIMNILSFILQLFSTLAPSQPVSQSSKVTLCKTLPKLW